MHSKIDEYWIEHLMRRAGFGSTPDELKYYKNLGFEASVDELTSPEKVKNDKLDDILSKQDFDFTDMGDAKRWWIYRMSYSRRPLEEKMALFWHGHFATSNAKVGNPFLMYQQNELFRRNGLGDFQQMLVEVSKDPAMIIWLDNQQNRKGKPNENYAREIMELFTMGIGNYTEADIKEAARAFTGWAAPSTYYFNKKQHDDGEKTFLGQKGNFNGEDICKILADKPATAKYISKKLIAFLSHDDPDEATVERISDVYLSNNRSIRAVTKAILLDKTFRSSKAYHGKIKSPVELVVGTVKSLQVQKLDGDLSALMARMGQNLFEPPNVKGWDGGMAWIATDTMMERFNYAARISTQKFDTADGYINPTKLAKNYNVTNASEMVDNLLAALVDGDVPANTRKKLLAYVSSDLSDQDHGHHAKKMDAASNTSDHDKHSNGKDASNIADHDKHSNGKDALNIADHDKHSNGKDAPNIIASAPGAKQPFGPPSKQGPPSPTGKNLDVKMRGLIHLIMTLPSYQLS